MSVKQTRGSKLRARVRVFGGEKKGLILFGEKEQAGEVWGTLECVCVCVLLCSLPVCFCVIPIE